MAYLYPFDPTGNSSANRIPSEQHVLTARNFRDYHYVIPNFAPFFEENFSITLKYPSGTIRPLVYGVDYYFSNQFLDASRATAKPVFGSISFLDTDSAGVLTIGYNTVGGKWNLTPTEITRILAEEMRNPRITAWEQITDLPERFPVIDHEWDLVDMVGMKDVADVLETITAAILESGSGGLQQHVNDFQNPHQTTKLQVGLGNVLNYPVATTAQAQAGSSNAFYMTPLRVAEAIASIGGALVTTHATNTNNPHNTTKTQVGLGNVDNYATATQALAEAGVSTNTFMTPQRTSQAINAIVGNSVSSHIANQGNPHNVTKAQVGLFSVQNYAIATSEEARAGLVNDKYMTPLRTTQLVTEFVTTQLDGHATRVDNPHQVTKTQVGLGSVENYPIATIQQAQIGDSNVAYMTPGRTLVAINTLATPASHLQDKNNPHEVTADQVGAYSRVETDTILVNYIRTTDQWVAGMTKAAFIAEVLAGDAANALQLEGLSLAEVLIEAQSSFTGLFIETDKMYSRDSASSPGAGVTPFRWVALAELKPFTDTDTGGGDTISKTFPDNYWFMTGGHKQLGDAASSPAYIIHGKSSSTLANIKFDVTKIAGGATPTDVQFGQTYDSASETMTIWMKVAHGHNDLQSVCLTSMGVVTEVLVDDVVVEPAGIAYVVPTSLVDTAALAPLQQEVQDQGATLTNALTTLNQTISQLTQTVNDNQAGLDQRVTALEDTLNSVTVV